MPDYAAHEAVYFSQAITADDFAMKKNPKYVNKVVAPTLEPISSIGGFRTLPDYSFDTMPDDYVALVLVRQHFVHFLLAHKGYPQALMANEVQVQLNGTKKRCDTVLYRRDLTARMIVEYKAPEIEITQKVFDQITRYNMVLKVDYLIVSNGLQHYCCRIDYEHNSYTFLQDIPEYQNL